MKYRNLLIGLSCMAGFCACDDEYTFVPEYEVKLPTDTTINVRIDASQVYQTIDGFASSDAWDMEYVGKYWSASNKEAIARLLFSREVDDKGNSLGIGLSMWRFNVGGGSEEQGDASGIVSDKKERRADCFLTSANGGYDWSKSSGRRYFMEKAKEYGCESFVLFSNTPPVYYTYNGLARSDRGAYSNLKPEHYDDYADFLATVAKHFQDEGYNIDYISPVNEPQYNWNGNEQEGSAWQNAEIAKLARELDASLTAKGLSNTNMLLAEAGKWDYLYGNGDAGASRGNVVEAFFNPSNTETYIGNLTHLPKLICGHSYWLDTRWDNMYSVRSQVKSKAEQYGLKVYQTEWSMLSENYEDYASYDDASYMDLALSMARVIHQDLATANVSSWAYWTTCSRERWSQKSRFYLIRLSPDGADESYADLSTNGIYSASKNLWVLGNYSAFVRPGYQRIELNMENATKDFFATAYISPEKDKLVVVYTNMTNKRAEISNTFEGLGKEAVSFEQYTTSEAKDLKREASYNKGVVPAKAISTFVYDLQ